MVVSFCGKSAAKEVSVRKRIACLVLAATLTMGGAHLAMAAAPPTIPLVECTPGGPVAVAGCAAGAAVVLEGAKCAMGQRCFGPTGEVAKGARAVRDETAKVLKRIFRW